MTTALVFKTRVGLHSPFFAAKTGEAPTVTMSGPTGDHAIEVSESHHDPEWGERWVIWPPEPWWAVGRYEIAAGETTYIVDVGPARVDELGQLDVTPDERRRLRSLTPADREAARNLALLSLEETS